MAVTDLILAGITQTAQISGSGATALVVLATAPQVSVTELGRRVGLSQSAAARMVDSLQAGRLVDWYPGIGREVAVQLTAAGRHVAGELLSARTRALTDVLDVLSNRERDTLAALLCRLCDRRTCTSNATCPVGQAGRDHLL